MKLDLVLSGVQGSGLLPQDTINQWWGRGGEAPPQQMAVPKWQPVIEDKCPSQRQPLDGCDAQKIQPMQTK